MSRTINPSLAQRKSKDGFGLVSPGGLGSSLGPPVEIEQELGGL
jgi:hypothetical protein